jgi:hypothetical protein
MIWNIYSAPCQAHCSRVGVLLRRWGKRAWPRLNSGTGIARIWCRRWRCKAVPSTLPGRAWRCITLTSTASYPPSSNGKPPPPLCSHPSPPWHPDLLPSSMPCLFDRETPIPAHFPQQTFCGVPPSASTLPFQIFERFLAPKCPHPNEPDPNVSQ